MTSHHERFMALAIEEALSGLREGERPFGSVVVRDETIVGRGRNRVNTTFDPTTHAEILAIRDAAANLKELRLTGCTLYTTCEPCPMCCGAILYSGKPPTSNIDTLVMGTRFADVRTFAKGLFEPQDYTVERLLELTGANPKIVSGVMQEDCEAIYRNWQG